MERENLGLKKVYDVYQRLHQLGLTFIKPPKRMIIINSKGMSILKMKKGDYNG